MQNLKSTTAVLRKVAYVSGGEENAVGVMPYGLQMKNTATLHLIVSNTQMAQLNPLLEKFYTFLYTMP